MPLFKFVSAVLIGLSVSGCAVTDIATRNAPMDLSGLAPDAQVQMRSYDVRGVNVIIPRDLSVSESNRFYPLGDIVWRGDPLGDRKQQIAEIFQTSVTAAGQATRGDTPVLVQITLHRFHSVSERARYTTGGVHNIRFEMAIVHADTGVVIESWDKVSGDLDALGGTAAIEAERNGQGQKVRVIANLTMLFADMLHGPATALVPGDATS